ncbi:MAG: hypothetical protein ACREYE_01450 [Gammaproteobacteria bacterium]
MPDLKEAIEEVRQAWNQNPKSFIWTAPVEDIIKKIERARVKMEQIKPRSTLSRGKKEGGLTVKLFKGHYTIHALWGSRPFSRRCMPFSGQARLSKFRGTFKAHQPSY